MRFARYQYGNEQPRYGWVLKDQIGLIEGKPFEEFRRMEIERPLDSVKLLPPVLPGKIVGVGRNYADHAKELNNPIPDVPMLFLKAPSALIGPGELIVAPPQSSQVEHEAELAVVIGKKARWVKPEDAHQVILGYTIANDMTARDLQRKDGQWTRAKAFDTFCPLGPWIETDFDPADAMITCHVNNEMRQMASTREMLFTVPQLIAFISSVMTLYPGDVILTGTPAGVGPVYPGDTISIKIAGIGELRNPVGAGG
ncbi:MAG: fumarylacetoacetate hydrolase family protein [Anaerolineaceae bacterium]